MTSNRTIFKASYLLSLVAFVLSLAPRAFAQTSQWTGACVGGPDKDVATILGLECLLANILGVAITIIGVAAFVMFLIGSFRYLTAGSNTKGVEGGKNAFSFAVLGIVVALASFLVLRFISNFTGVTSFLEFNTQVDDTNRR